MRFPKLAQFAWILLIYNFAVVAWGGWVRVSFSGDGCGAHWPLCDGQVIPAFPTLKRVVEFSHRASSGLVLLLVAILLFWVWKVYKAGEPVRKAAAASMFFCISEALVGMVLVLYKLVAYNDSFNRAASMSLHLCNTFFLLGSLALTALLLSGVKPPTIKGQGAVPYILGVAAFAICVLGVSGSVSALGHALKPVPDVLAAAMDPASNWMVKLQPLHPLIAISVGLYLLLASGLLIHLRPSKEVKVAVQRMMSVYAVQVALGLLNVVLKAPDWLQIVHLVLADLLFVAFVAAGAAAMASGVRKVELEVPEGSHPVEHSAPKLRGAAYLKAYLSLTKPRVISLLIFTTMTAMFMAARGWPGGWLLVAVFVGGYMSAGAANAINMVVDRDIDGAMRRTASRPTVTQSIPSRDALLFAFALAAGSFGLLWWAANLLTAMLALAGLVFYVIVYTMVLKRRTWQNIVIGGAAGAFPPLVGWAAVTNSLNPFAWWLFAVILVWTPVHFWALALLLKDDYAAAGVPMLPVVRGERVTVIQILLYAVLTALVTAIPYVLHQLGQVYLVSAVMLNIPLVAMALKLRTSGGTALLRPKASRLFHYSMVYLAALFLMVAVDRALGGWVAGRFGG
ncbi:MAG TPA: heme o synthase [Fimbriimonadaceae bacterium]|nr:heme o synthase [Fimbriimonadaceae bacterium]